MSPRRLKVSGMDNGWLKEAAALALSGQSLDTLLEEHQSEVDFALAEQYSLSALLGSATKVPGWQRAHLDSVRRVLVQAADLFAVTAALDRFGIRWIAYKGIALAAQTTGDPTLRGYGDNDILVSPTDLALASQALALAKAGSTLRITPAQNRVTRLFAWLHNETHFAMAHSDLDVHWRLTKPAGVSPSFDALYQRSVQVEAFGRTLRTLGVADHIAVVSYGFYVDGAKSVKQVLDLHRLAGLAQSVQLPDGYSAQLNHLAQAAVSLALAEFGPESGPATRSAQPGAPKPVLGWVRRLTARSNSEQPKEISSNQVSLLSVSQQVRTLASQVSLGKGFSNFIRFGLDKLLDFEGLDFAQDRAVVLKALINELKVQVVGRFTLAAERRRAQKRAATKRKKPLWKIFAAALMVAWLVQFAVAKIYYIPSSSMEPTLITSGLDSDRILVLKADLPWVKPVPGSIVVFRKPASWDSAAGAEQPPGLRAWIGEITGLGNGVQKPVVKRLIAVGGQRVSCCDLAGKMTVDGKPVAVPPLEFPYVNGVLDCHSVPQSMRCFADFTVPAGHLFVLGDNRLVSNDSLEPCRLISDKKHCVRFVAERNLIGVVAGVVYPLSRLNFSLTK